MFLDSNWRRELVHAARRLRNAPGFAAVAILTLAIGVGVNTAMFGLIDSLLFRPPAHVADPDGVVRVQFTSGPGPEIKTWWRSNYPAFQDVAATRAFEAVAGYTDATVSIGRGVDAYEARAMIVTPAFFRVLGVRPHAGSLFGTQPTDTLVENHVVLSHGFWERQLGRDPRVIGAPLIIGTSSYVVSGIAPNGFTSLQDRPVDVWLPMNDLAAGYLVREWRTNRGSYWLDVVARVPTSTTTATQERASAVLRLAAQERGRGAPSGIVTASIISSRNAEKSREVRVSLWLAGVTAFVLLIACANVANLVLARNVARGREYAVRLSLGASSWQLRRQLIADVCAVAIPGLLAALLVEYAVRAAIPAFLATEIPIPRGFLDARSLALMSASGFVAIALVSIVSLTQVRPAAMVRALTTNAIDDRRGGAWTRSSLLALQSGLCVALLFSAGLFAKSLNRVLSLDLGVEMDRTVQVSFNIPRGSRTPAEQQSGYDRALERVRAHPGVERAALSVAAPFQSGMGAGPFTEEQTQRELWEGKGEVAYSAAVGTGFFASVGAASLVGRDFTEDDKAGAPKVAIITTTLAARLWPKGGGLGNCLFMDETGECHRVVGVLGGVWKLRALDRNKMAIYTPLAQTPNARPGALLVRTRGPVGPMLAPLRSTVQSIEPDLPAVRVSRARDLVDYEFRPWRLGATLFAGFSAIALIIAAVGLYGVVSFTTTLRNREIGVRMALGARTWDVIRVVAGAGLGAVVAGLIVGSGVSLVASRWMGDVLYQTSPRDPAVLAQTAAVLLVVAIVAVVAPVLRALRLAPAAVLRSE
ncbi:MAG: ABC transporter permease [Gemmatimonadaceae bacterium]